MCAWCARARTRVHGTKHHLTRACTCQALGVTIYKRVVPRVKGLALQGVNDIIWLEDVSGHCMRGCCCHTCRYRCLACSGHAQRQPFQGHACAKAAGLAALESISVCVPSAYRRTVKRRSASSRKQRKQWRRYSAMCCLGMQHVRIGW